eukprot:CAMPEP_0176131406 /NCGR_PEP_ID=MMETSP0120_2-20121206/66523_1 /TAXON_ID=160619 /ORGANISM="Kryptoperidinium foliaceum, Strain CCMP 1326" /LENGTH=216 /DNA_ID=CAMNT_0017466779 /DNA_START=81 /DNA_END=731 /DNA_ORIENTATION=+
MKAQSTLLKVSAGTLLLLHDHESSAFQAPLSAATRRADRRSHTRLNVVGMETVGIAVLSAAAGAAAQVPRIQKLEGELEKAKGALEMSKADMVAKITQLEDKLFQMDTAYEEQSAKFMKEMEAKKKEEVEQATDKIKTDYRYKLEIEVERAKSKLLTETLTDVKISADQSVKLAEMKLQMDQLRSAKDKLQKALQLSESELNRINGKGKAKGSWPF